MGYLVNGLPSCQRACELAKGTVGLLYFSVHSVIVVCFTCVAYVVVHQPLAFLGGVEMP